MGPTDFIDDILGEEEDDAGEQGADGRAPVIKLLDLSGSPTRVVSHQPHSQAGEINMKHFEIFGVAQHVVDNDRVSLRNIIRRGRGSLGVTVDAAGGLDNLGRAV